MHTHAHTHAHTRTHTHTHAHVLKCRSTRTHMQRHIKTHAHTHTHTHIRAFRRSAHVHTHTHTHVCTREVCQSHMRALVLASRQTSITPREIPPPSHTHIHTHTYIHTHPRTREVSQSHMRALVLATRQMSITPREIPWGVPSPCGVRWTSRTNISTTMAWPIIPSSGYATLRQCLIRRANRFLS